MRPPLWEDRPFSTRVRLALAVNWERGDGHDLAPAARAGCAQTSSSTSLRPRVRTVEPAPASPQGAGRGGRDMPAEVRPLERPAAAQGIRLNQRRERLREDRGWQKRIHTGSSRFPLADTPARSGVLAWARVVLTLSWVDKAAWRPSSRHPLQNLRWEESRLLFHLCSNTTFS